MNSVFKYTEICICLNTIKVLVLLQPVSGFVFTLPIVQWEDEENQRGTLPMFNRAAAPVTKQLSFVSHKTDIRASEAFSLTPPWMKKVRHNCLCTPHETSIHSSVLHKQHLAVACSLQHHALSTWWKGVLK